MNNYQLKILWATVIILGLSTYPLYLFVFEMQETSSLILASISIVVLLSGALFLSLQSQKEEELKSRIKMIKKFLLVLFSIIIIVVAFYAVKYVIKSIEVSNYEKKEMLLTNHIKNTWWIINNLEISNENLWYNKDNSHKGYLRLTEFNFVLRNKSQIDITAFPIFLEIYNNENEPMRFQKEFIVYCNISAYSSKNIKHLFDFNELDMIPEGFIWVYHTEGKVIPNKNYIRNKTYDEINSYVISDSASLKSNIQIDWEGLTKDLEDLNKNIKENIQE